MVSSAPRSVTPSPCFLRSAPKARQAAALKRAGCRSQSDLVPTSRASPPVRAPRAPTGGDARLVGTKSDWLRHPARFSAAAWRAFGALRKKQGEGVTDLGAEETITTLGLRYVGAAR